MRSRLIGLGLVLALGCAGAPEVVRVDGSAGRAEAEVARVLLRSRVLGFDLELTAVDGRRTSVFEWQELELLPGERALWLEGEDPRERRVFFGPGGAPTRERPAEPSFVLAAEAGGRYLVLLEGVGDGGDVRARLARLDGGAAAASPPAERADGGPYVLVLGTAQDGGLPQVGCEEPPCVAARRDPARRRLVTSLLLVDPRSGSRWLFEATPDLREQVALAAGHPAGRAPAASSAGGRPPLFEGVFLTHAHMGHYTGLLHLGREAYGARDLPLHVSARMAGFLRGNDPWRTALDQGSFRLATLTPGEPVALADDLSVEAFAVPHRDEYSDTLGFVVRGPRRALLFVPDIDKWERWDERVEDRLAGVDVALLDGTFYAAWELPGRDLAEIPHPFVVESIARFQSLPADERAKVVFTHLNHTNPVADPDSPEAAAVRAAGMAVAREGQRIGL